MIDRIAAGFHRHRIQTAFVKGVIGIEVTTRAQCNHSRCCTAPYVSHGIGTPVGIRRHEECRTVISGYGKRSAQEQPLIRIHTLRELRIGRHRDTSATVVRDLDIDIDIVVDTGGQEQVALLLAHRDLVVLLSMLVGFLNRIDRRGHRDVSALVLAEKVAQDRIRVPTRSTSKVKLHFGSRVIVVLRIEPHGHRQIKGVTDVPFDPCARDGHIIIRNQPNGIITAGSALCPCRHQPEHEHKQNPYYVFRIPPHDVWEQNSDPEPDQCWSSSGCKLLP